jgi:trehalose-6-phosphate synthase
MDDIQRRWVDRVGLTPSDELVVASNRPPMEIAGGAVKVIAEMPIKAWIGPGKTVSDEQWTQMPDTSEPGGKYELSHTAVPYGDSTINVYTFPHPESLQEAQYTHMSNGLLWPINHSTDARVFNDPMSITDTSRKPDFNYSYKGSDGQSNPDTDWEKYKEFNTLFEKALGQLKEQGIITGREPVNPHDYQIATVPGQVYTSHTPFASRDYLEQVEVNDKPILPRDGQEHWTFFEENVRALADHDIVTFQRPEDMKNFIETVAVLDPSFNRNNPSLLNEDGRVQGEFAVNESKKIVAFGKPMTALNVPVAIRHEELTDKARDMDDKDFTTKVDVKALEKTGVKYDPDAVQEVTDNKGNTKKVVPLGDLLKPILEPDQGHKIIMAVHRNDYTKNTYEKLLAASDFMAKHPEEEGKTHFVFFLQPSRENVSGYAEYRDRVCELADGLAKQYGDSFIIIPQGVDNADALKLMRHENTAALLGTGLKDGHDLTVREAAGARSDYAETGDLERSALAIVTSNGTGASDVFKGSAEKPAAYVLDSSKSVMEFKNQLAEAYADIVEKSNSPDGKRELGQRYANSVELSKQYGIDNFVNTITKAVNDNQREKQSSRGL